MITLFQSFSIEIRLAHVWKSVVLAGLFLLLNACSSTPSKIAGKGNLEAYQFRADKLTAVDEWGLVGKISLDDGDQGGSGRVQWDVKRGHSDLDFHAAMGRGAWRLQVSPEGAVLKEANGAEQNAPRVNELIQDRMGWPVPVDALQWWVRGLAAPGTIEYRQIDSEGLLVRLHQFGWNVEFNRYDSDSGLALPKRLNAIRDQYRVKLAVSRWRMGDAHAGRQ